MDSLMAGSCARSALTSVDLPAPEGATTMNRLPEEGRASDIGLPCRVLHRLKMKLFEILNLFAHLLNQELHRHRRVGQFLERSLGADRVRFAVEFLHHEIEALADLATFFQDLPGFGQMGRQAC